MEKIEFSWMALIVACVVNWTWIAIMYGAQQCDLNMPARHSIIPGTRQRFIHMQDFWTCSWGDCLPLCLILNAFVTLAMADKITVWQWLSLGIMSVILGIGFLVMCLGKDHKPDQGYPAPGKVSLHGYLHLPHFGVSVSMVVLTVWHIIIGNFRGGPVLYLFIVGAVLWAITFVLDVKSGNFDPLKLDLHDPDPEHERQEHLRGCC